MKVGNSYVIHMLLCASENMYRTEKIDGMLLCASYELWNVQFNENIAYL